MIIDGWEVFVYWEATFEISKDSYHIYTDPNNKDTDNDGVPDGFELDWNKDTDGNGDPDRTAGFINDANVTFIIKYNNDINALDYDSDDDGIWDGTEMGITDHVIRNGEDHTAGNIDINKTNWVDNETLDPPEYEFEVKFKADGDGGVTITDMTNNDTDHDGLEDGEEDSNNSGTWDTGEPNPLDGDTDDDGMLDYNSSSWIAVDKDGSIELDEPDTFGLTIYEYIGVFDPVVPPSKEIDVYYNSENKSVRTPNRQMVYLSGLDDKNYTYAWIRYSSSAYIKFVVTDSPGSYPANYTSYRSQPHADNTTIHNFVAYHQETYDDRVVLSAYTFYMIIT